MIKYIEELFLTDKTARKIDTIKENIANKKWFTKVCLITLSRNSNDVFDIIQLYNLKTASEQYEDIIIFGIAENKAKAIEMCHEMINEYILEDNKKQYSSMREYFMDKYI